MQEAQRRALNGIPAVAPPVAPRRVEPPASRTRLIGRDDDVAEVGNRFLGGVARVSLAALRADRGEPAASLADLLEVVEHWYECGAHSYLVTSLRNPAGLLQRLGEPEQAARVLGVVDEEAGVPTYGEEAARPARTAAELERLLGTGAFRAAHARGRATTIAEVLVSLGGHS